MTSLIGFAIMLGSWNPGVRYFGAFPVAMGLYSSIANTVTWISNNTEGLYKRAIVMGMAIGGKPFPDSRLLCKFHEMLMESIQVLETSTAWLA